MKIIQILLSYVLLVFVISNQSYALSPPICFAYGSCSKRTYCEFNNTERQWLSGTLSGNKKLVYPSQEIDYENCDTLYYIMSDYIRPVIYSYLFLYILFGFVLLHRRRSIIKDFEYLKKSNKEIASNQSNLIVANLVANGWGKRRSKGIAKYAKEKSHKSAKYILIAKYMVGFIFLIFLSFILDKIIF